jgi:hypothetical protein
MKLVLILCILSFLAFKSCFIANKQKEHLKVNNCLSDSLAAVNFTKKIWEDSVGIRFNESDTIEVNLKGDSIWEVVRNTEHSKFIMGGGCITLIRAKDCKILKMYGWN